MKIFLTANWKNLIMVNYTVDPALLLQYLPNGTELDSFNGNYYVSLVAFMFMQTKIKGISIPFYKNFEEVNLRFYVRFKENNEWKRGVVFIKEIVPKRIICLVANGLYGEHYTYGSMKNELVTNENTLDVKYEWNYNNQWNFIQLFAEKKASPVIQNSKEEFITEHYWGYSKLNNNRTAEYNVLHPKWNIHKVHSYDLFCNTKALYGENFESTLKQKPASALLAEGSTISVSEKRILKF